jgi:serine/threonine protein phosphatase 1
VPSFAISDIHGCSQTFTALLDKIAFSKSDSLYLLGDYIDRGPNSKGVIDQILKLTEEGYRVHCLRGNHEQMMLDGLTDNNKKCAWEMAGGKEALLSFGVDDLSEIPEKYIRFFHNLEYYFEADGYILVHAGLNFWKTGRLEDKTSMLWSRSWYDDIDYEWLGERIIIHGHTPQSRMESDEQLAFIQTQRYLNIDNGCVFAHRVRGMDMGNLLAFDMTNQVLNSVANID